MPLFGSEKIAEPVSFVGIRLGKEMYQGKAKVVSQGGRQVPATIAVEETDDAVEGQVGCVVPRPNMPMFDVVAVLPLIPGQVVELQEQAPGPTLAGLPGCSESHNVAVAAASIWRRGVPRACSSSQWRTGIELQPSPKNHQMTQGGVGINASRRDLSGWLPGEPEECQNQCGIGPACPSFHSTLHWLPWQCK